MQMISFGYDCWKGRVNIGFQTSERSLIPEFVMEKTVPKWEGEIVPDLLRFHRSGEALRTVTHLTSVEVRGHRHRNTIHS
jgi:hypothetical protein